ncbi:MAG: hypothetical protein ACYS7M_10970, partial [Planctomycetota bacterium]
MDSRVQSYACVGLVFLMSNGVVADPKPPAPNPAQPVDYVKWINETLGGDIEDNAYEAYTDAYKQIAPFGGDWGDALDGPWSENQEVSGWLAANREGLGKFRVAARKRECFFPVQAPDAAGDP